MENSTQKLTVAITGSTGLIGKKLSKALENRGHKVIKLVRSNNKNNEIDFQTRFWDLSNPNKNLLEDVDVLVHLAGKSIVGRFTKNHIKQIEESRITPTKKLAEIVATTPSVQAFICASAIGYYGYNTQKIVDENSFKGEGVLSNLCEKWEKACEEVTKTGKRLVNIRTGIVLDKNGTFLKNQILLTKLFLNATLGGGQNYISWIGSSDIINIYVSSVENKTFKNIINATSPNFVTNTEFAKTLSKLLKKPLLFNIPTFVLKCLLGCKGAKELALADQKVIPGYLIGKGYKFIHPTLNEALEFEINKNK